MRKIAAFTLVSIASLGYVLSPNDCSTIKIRREQLEMLIELGKETVVSTSEQGGLLKCEPSAAMSDSAIIVTWNDSFGGMRGCGDVGTVVAWSISRDGGRSFVFGGILPLITDNAISCAADSWVRADQNGDFYLTILAIQSDRHEIQCYLMKKEKLGHWIKLANPAVVLTPDHGGLDRPSMITGENGTIGVTYTRLSPDYNYFIDVVFSFDGGRTWNPAKTVSDRSKKSRLCATAALSRDTIWIAWLEGSGYTIDELWWTVSFDRGKTFKSPQMLYKLSTEALFAPDGYTMSNGLGPVILIDPPSLVANGKHTFLVWIEPAGDGRRILQWAFNSTNGTWTKPQQFGQDSSALKMFASMALTSESEAVLYYDRRNGPGTSMTDVYLTLRRNGLSTDVKLNNVSTQWNTTGGDSLYAPVQRVFGDYITLTSHSNKYLATWTDGRNGRTTIYSRLLTLK